MTEPTYSDARQHGIWLRGMVKRLADNIAERDITNEPVALCGRCGCKGNMECGHLPLDSKVVCTISGDEELCQCCLIQHEPMSDAEYDKEIGQGRLI